MANHLSTKKAIRKTIKKSLINKSRHSQIKTYITKVQKAIDRGAKEEAESIFVTAQSKIMKGVNKQILKANTAARKVSKLVKKINNMS